MRPRSLFLLCRALALAALVTADDEDLLAHMNEVEMEHFFGTSDAEEVNLDYEIISIRKEIKRAYQSTRVWLTNSL